MHDNLCIQSIKITDIYLHVVNKQQKWVVCVVSSCVELQIR